MKTIIRWVLVSVVMLMAGFVAEAQHKTYVRGLEDAKPVAGALRSRIGASSRYEVTDKVSDAEIIVDVTCFNVRAGISCGLAISYFPPQTFPLFRDMGVDLLTDANATSMGERMFEQFASDTSEDKLKAAVGMMVNDVKLFCSFPANKNYCN